jgi:hypothetical protein
MTMQTLSTSEITEVAGGSLFGIGLPSTSFLGLGGIDPSILLTFLTNLLTNVPANILSGHAIFGL